jgi:hypothetical protein
MSEVFTLTNVLQLTVIGLLWLRGNSVKQCAAHLSQIQIFVERLNMRHGYSDSQLDTIQQRKAPAYDGPKDQGR